MKPRILRGLVRGSALLLAAPICWLLYSIIHEVGHVLALKAFDAWGNGEASLAPLPGQAPHVSADPSAQLEPWQAAITAISGGLLPTLVGYLSFVLWATPYGSRHRSSDFLIEIIWSLFTITMLSAQAVPAMLFPNAMRDRDYALFIRNVGVPPWIANAGITVVALVNLTLVIWIARHFVSRVRAIKAVKRTGTGSPPPEADRPPSTAGSLS